MVIKILPARSQRRRKWLNGPQVCLPKIDVTAYKVVPSTSQSKSPGCMKSETLCFFNSEVDLLDNGNDVRVEERNLGCACGYCSPLYEFKERLREEFVKQQGANSPFNPPPVDEFPWVEDSEKVLPPQPAFATNVGTQTAQRTYRFTCRDCRSEFNDEYYFDLHRKVHSKMLECAFCEAQFFNEKSLEMHLLIHLKGSVYECIYCQAVYRKKKFLNQHLKVHEKFAFGCNSCTAKFETKKSLELHQKTHSSSGRLIHVFRKLKANQEAPTDHCTVETVEPQPVQQHASKEANGFFECRKCNLKFHRMVEWRKHDIIHSRNGKKYLHTCSKCNARFRFIGHLTIHQKAAHK